jgi:sec-independent protein translocase protein TatA
MFQNIGFSEILLIGIVALLVFGPQKLPEIGRMIGKTVNEFKRSARGMMEEIKTESPAQKLENERTPEQVQTIIPEVLQTQLPEAGTKSPEAAADKTEISKAARRLPD